MDDLSMNELDILVKNPGPEDLAMSNHLKGIVLKIPKGGVLEWRCTRVMK